MFERLEFFYLKLILPSKPSKTNKGKLSAVHSSEESVKVIFTNKKYIPCKK